MERQVQSYGEHAGQVVCAERAKLRVASAGESKGAILSRPKKNALGTFRRAAQKTVVFERVHLRPSGAYKSVTYRLRRPEVFERPARAGSCYKVAQGTRNLTFKCPILLELKRHPNRTRGRLS